MDNILTDEKFESIIKNTVIDTNRVLKLWQENKKLITYEDKISLVRGNLAKYFKHYFGWQIYKRHLQKYDILPVIDNYLLLKISISLGAFDGRNPHILGLKKALETLNILEISEKYKEPSFIEEIPNTTDLKSLVNYELITNIKFT